MSRSLLTAAFGLFALTISAGTTPVQASPVSSYSVVRPKLAGLTQTGIAQARQSGADHTGLVTMQSQTALGLLKQATKIGPHAASSTIELTVSLKLHNIADLKQFLRDVQNPRSPEYRHFLTPEQFTARYGASQAQVDTVIRFLKQRGIRVKNISANRLLIHTEATTQVYEHALAIRINDYQLNGRSFFSTPDRPKLPSAVAGRVENIIGLNNAAQLHPLHQVRPLATGGTRPAASAPPPVTSAYYNPMQIAKAYEWPSITDPANAAGVTIAILTADSSNFKASESGDYTGFWSAFNLSGHTANFIPVDGDHGSTDGIIETLLDMEWSGAMAPGATLDVYVGSDPTLATFMDVYNQVATDDTAQVATISWSAAESVWGSVAETADAIFMQAAAEGISIFVASGDHGASAGTGDANMAEYPSSSLYVTAANGTELHADKNGNYISERAWSDTGGAVSEIFDEPDWQIGPGVPQNGHRNNSDLALNGGGAWPYLLLYQDTWYLVWGTSAVAPQLAALFAVGVSQNGRIGQSNVAIYDDVNASPGNYARDFRDVTMGCNGKLPDGSPSCATTNWDHPTGWGSPRATNLLSHLGVQGPRGTLKGTVTAVASASSIAEARVTVTPDNYSRVTAGDGGYSFVLPAGDYTIAVQDFGYKQQSASVTIDDGDTVTQDFALEAAPRATISGKVSDGSGHGYGLYADIKVTAAGVYHLIADLWTDPKTGAYSLNLPQGYDYTFNVATALDGYDPVSATLTPTGDTTQNFPMTISPTCSAPGYGFMQGFGEDFNGDFPPDGWAVTNEVAESPVVWQLNTAYGDDNYTGGSGTAAEANSDHAGLGQGPYDTRLISPPIPVSTLPADPVLRYQYAYQQSYGSSETFDLGISSDDGAHWTKILSTDYCGTPYSLPGCRRQVDLAPYLPASGDIELRWRYYDSSAGAWDWYAQLDDVAIGTCQMIPGGLVLGQVSDANTGDALLRATVSDEQGDSAVTLTNVADPALPEGFYTMFTPTGDGSLTASGGYYQPATAKISMTANAILTQNFGLNAGDLIANPTGFDVKVAVDAHALETLTLKNTGSAPAHYRIIEANPALSTAGAATSVRASAAGTAAGSIIASFAPGFGGAYGLGVDRNANELWIGSSPSARFGNRIGGDSHDYPFLPDGTAVTGAGIDVSALSPGNGQNDMAFDDNTGMLWQAGGQANELCIYELDPVNREVTGKKICPVTGVFETAIAYDPTTDTWYTDDPQTETVSHFDSSGEVLDSQYVPVKAVALAYNSATGHLFALAAQDKHSVYVLDPADDYKILSSFDVAGLNDNGGAGLDYDCNGDLWATDATSGNIYEFNAGEGGWCDFKNISWLSETPASGTITPGASAKVTLDFDGGGQQASTTSKSRIVVQTGTPYDNGVIAVSLTVAWTPPANQPPVASDGSLTTDENKAASGTLKATDPNGDPLTFIIVSQPGHGSVTLDDDSSGAYTYTPDQGFSGNDSFTFKANDGEADSGPATISVTVKAASSGGGGGGGALGPWGLTSLLLLSLLILLYRIFNTRLSRRKSHD